MLVCLGRSQSSHLIIRRMKQGLDKINIYLIAASLVVIIVGLVLMMGAPSGADAYNPDIFSFRRITVGPMISLLGFVLMVVAILWKGKRS